MTDTPYWLRAATDFGERHALKTIAGGTVPTPLPASPSRVARGTDST